MKWFLLQWHKFWLAKHSIMIRIMEDSANCNVSVLETVSSEYKNAIQKVSYHHQRRQELEASVSAVAILHHYWNENFTHTPYRNSLMQQKLGDFSFQRLLESGNFDDGDEVEITIRKTGKRPHGDKKVVFTKPHTYELLDCPNISHIVQS